MANIKELKKRIKSTKSTLKITTAMKLVSAAKLAKAQGRIQGFRPYSSELDGTVRVCSALAENYTHPYLQEKSNSKSVLLVISSDKGLCGGYNSQLYKNIKRFLAEHTDEDIELRFIGKKVRQLLMRDKLLKEGKTYTFDKAEPTFVEVKKIATELAGLFTSNKIGRVYVAYNSFISALAFNSNVSTVLPMTVSEEEKVQLAQEFPVDFIYEPSAQTLLDSLIPEVLNTTMYTYVLDAIASEHGSRMSAMDSASTNSKEMIRKLTLKTNKLRQAAITTELSEVVSGAESLNS